MELCYRTNPRSLFRKYRHLVTWYAQRFDKNVLLFLPNGQIEGSEGSYRLKVFSRAVNAPRIYPVLRIIDSLAYRLSSFQEASQVLWWYLQGGTMPAILRRFHFNQMTFNPNADTETTSVDGRVNKTGPDTWATMTTGNGTAAQDAAGNTAAPLLTTSGAIPHGTGADWDEIGRAFYLFDTSALPDDAVVLNTSKVEVYVTAKSTTLGSQSLRLVNSSPASNTALATSDFTTGIGSTQQATGDVTLASVSTSALNAFTLNATGMGNVSLTGITKFGMRIVADADNSEPTWADSVSGSITVNFAEVGSNIPVLTVDFVSRGASFLFNFV